MGNHCIYGNTKVIGYLFVCHTLYQSHNHILLTIGQCIGATLKEVSDSLTPLTAEIVDNIQDPEAGEEAAAEEAPEEAAVPAVAVPAGTQMTFGGGVVKLYIAEGKDIAIEFPV